MYFLYRVFCNVRTYVSCPEYDGTLEKCTLQSVNQGGTTDNQFIRPWQKTTSAKDLFFTEVIL